MKSNTTHCGRLCIWKCKLRMPDALKRSWSSLRFGHLPGMGGGLWIFLIALRLLMLRTIGMQSIFTFVLLNCFSLTLRCFQSEVFGVSVGSPMFSHSLIINTVIHDTYQYEITNIFGFSNNDHYYSLIFTIFTS